MVMVSAAYRRVVDTVGLGRAIVVSEKTNLRTDSIELAENGMVGPETVRFLRQLHDRTSRSVGYNDQPTAGVSRHPVADVYVIANELSVARFERDAALARAEAAEKALFEQGLGAAIRPDVSLAPGSRRLVREVR